VLESCTRGGNWESCTDFSVPASPRMRTATMRFADEMRGIKVLRTFSAPYSAPLTLWHLSPWASSKRPTWPISNPCSLCAARATASHVMPAQSHWLHPAQDSAARHAPSHLQSVADASDLSLTVCLTEAPVPHSMLSRKRLIVAIWRQHSCVVQELFGLHAA
jgi:hypothetical protein